METFSPEDVLIDNLSFKLNKGSSYITDRKSTTFWSTGSNVYRPSSGNRVLKFSLNDEHGWLDPQSVMIYFTVQNLDTTLFRRLRPISVNPAVFFRRGRLLAGSQVLEDFNDFGRLSEMFDMLSNENVRANITAQGFGYRYDDYEQTLWCEGVTGQTFSEMNGKTVPGFFNKMTVGFKPIFGLFNNNYKYLPLKYMGNLTIELDLVNNETECIINPDDDAGTTFTKDIAGDADASVTNTSVLFELNQCRCVCDIATLDSNLQNEYVKHLLSSKTLPITYTTFVTQSQSVTGLTDINVQVVRSVSKLVATFISFYKSGDVSAGFEYADKEALRFYNPMTHSVDNPHGIYDAGLEMQYELQIGADLYPTYPCNSLSECFYHLRKGMNLLVFHQHSISIQFKEYKDRKFVFCYNASYTGKNLKSQGQMYVKIRPTGNIDVGRMPDKIFVTMLSEQILDIGDLGIRVFD